LIGGVGGTLTVLCYGYWLREEGRTHEDDLRVCRIDLATGYILTAVFGLAMVIVGSSISSDGTGARLLVMLSSRLEEVMGPAGKWLFLVGALGAVFSSLLGVWQSVPYLFSDCWGLLKRDGADRVARVDTRSAPYRAYLILIATVPMLGLFWSFREIQLAYAVTGALLFPVLALALLIFNGRSQWVGLKFRNRPLTIVVLIVVLLFFSWIGLRPFV
jgi:Mn2+/Fe2+ NRAMP family transporter